jgi:hypothetical protein
MVTLFTTPKPFVGHNAVIQWNALKSWTLLHPDVEVILFGDEDGAAETCRKLGLRHEPQVRRNENGTKYLNYIFDRAYQLSRHNFLCYANCDIMLTSDFWSALKVISKRHSHFLMIGRRWDTNINELWNFSQPDWEGQLRSLVLLRGKQSGPSWIDYFCFSRDLFYGKMPSFLIGRHGWDPWLPWFACNSKVPLIDASRMVMAVHQNHDYSYLKQGASGAHSKEEVHYNWNLGGATSWHYYAVNAATEVLSRGGLQVNRLALLGPVQRRLTRAFYRIWFSFLDVTRPIRHCLQLRKQSFVKRT